MWSLNREWQLGNKTRWIYPVMLSKINYISSILMWCLCTWYAMCCGLISSQSVVMIITMIGMVTLKSQVRDSVNGCFDVQTGRLLADISRVALCKTASLSLNLDRDFGLDIYIEIFSIFHNYYKELSIYTITKFLLKFGSKAILQTCLSTPSISHTMLHCSRSES